MGHCADTEILRTSRQVHRKAYDYMVKTNRFVLVRVFEEKGDCIVCLEIRADKLMRRLISGELTNYSVVRTSPEPLQS
jgi:hypothetical protein